MATILFKEGTSDEEVLGELRRREVLDAMAGRTELYVGYFDDGYAGVVVTGGRTLRLAIPKRGVAAKFLAEDVDTGEQWSMTKLQAEYGICEATIWKAFSLFMATVQPGGFTHVREIAKGMR